MTLVTTLVALAIFFALLGVLIILATLWWLER